ncbi:MAG TPA: hypothetical protein PKD54_00560 [Pirellulaceae bacterium]|nr:hypothetical protein [Pirellulaceae bacterium]
MSGGVGQSDLAPGAKADEPLYATPSVAKSVGTMDTQFDAEEIDPAAIEEAEFQKVLGTHWDGRMYCFRCHRMERHATALSSRWYYSYLVGITFGMIWLLGPFRCRCCTSLRWFRFEWMHPRRWW